MVESGWPDGMRGSGGSLKVAVLAGIFSTLRTPAGGGGFNRSAHSAGPDKKTEPQWHGASEAIIFEGSGTIFGAFGTIFGAFGTIFGALGAIGGALGDPWGPSAFRVWSWRHLLAPLLAPRVTGCL